MILNLNFLLDIISNFYFYKLKHIKTKTLTKKTE